MRSTPSTTSSRPTIRTPTNCRTRSISGSGRSRRRCRPSKRGRRSTIPPTSPAPAFSSASMTEGVLSVDRGYVRPEDEAPVVVDAEAESDSGGETADGAGDLGRRSPRTVITVGGAPAGTGR